MNIDDLDFQETVAASTFVKAVRRIDAKHR